MTPYPGILHQCLGMCSLIRYAVAFTNDFRELGEKPFNSQQMGRQSQGQWRLVKCGVEVILNALY